MKRFYPVNAEDHREAAKILQKKRDAAIATAASDASTVVDDVMPVGWVLGARSRTTSLAV